MTPTMCAMCDLIGKAVTDAAQIRENATTVRMVASEIGTADTLTERGMGKALLLRAIGPQSGLAGLAAVEIVIDSDLVAPFLAHVHAEAHALFPDEVPAPDTATAPAEQKEASSPR